MIGCFGTDFANSHDFISADAYWIFKAVTIPELK